MHSTLFQVYVPNYFKGAILKGKVNIVTVQKTMVFPEL